MADVGNFAINQLSSHTQLKRHGESDRGGCISLYEIGGFNCCHGSLEIVDPTTKMDESEKPSPRNAPNMWERPGVPIHPSTTRFGSIDDAWDEAFDLDGLGSVNFTQLLLQGRNWEAILFDGPNADPSSAVPLVP